jgi:succinyl-diaminopimelate desuccinylase
MSPTLKLAMELIRRPSVTPDDTGCQALIAERLAPLGFTIEHLKFGEVQNLWARRRQERPLLVLAGHTDVVPAGPLNAWTSDPFIPALRDGRLYGRGAADMKGSIAAMVTAVEHFIAAHPNHTGSIAFLLTSDEEGPAIDGTIKVIHTLTERNETMDWCLLGEPSCEERLGDVIKVGRRGSLNAILKVHGTQGHVAYPHRADNPVHRALPALAELCATRWDEGNAHFPPTSFQISNLHAGAGAENVIPGVLEVLFNFRYSTEWSDEALKQRVLEVFDRHGLTYQCDWRTSGQPFLTHEGRLLEATQQAIREVTGMEVETSTGGGTSDGRFIAPLGVEVIELGLLNRTIHKVDECVAVEDLEVLSKIYERVFEVLLTFQESSIGRPFVDCETNPTVPF